jgi:hypothetical protein
MPTYPLLSPWVYHCAACPTRCDGQTVPQFDFAHDVRFAEQIEQQVMAQLLARYPHLGVRKTTRPGYPDLELSLAGQPETCFGFLEVKGQARTFMKVAERLPTSGLAPSETIALNLSDLERYFAIQTTENRPIYLVWCLLNRPCQVAPGQSRFFHQELGPLRQIRQADAANTRRFRRRTGPGDVVDGQHRGVVVNYHFRLGELLPGLPDFSEIGW